MVQSQNQADEFDTVVLLDENAVREGRTEGILKGRIEGLREGRTIGIYRGFEIGQEVGFMKGCLDAWKASVDAATLSTRARQAMEGLERALRELPVTHAEDERLTDLLAVARSKFKVAASSLGMLGECTEGFEKMSGGSSGGKGGVRASDVDF